MIKILLKSSRIILGDMIEICCECKDVSNNENSPVQTLEFCKSSCTHWKAIQDQRKIIEELQIEMRSHRKAQWKERLIRYAL